MTDPNGVPPVISVVVPVYKAEGCLRELYTRLTTVLDELVPTHEIIMVEDCGGDGSWDVITRLAKEDKRVHGFKFSRNFGQHYGITAGIDHAAGDWIVVMDCDLQDRPEEIPALYEEALKGNDVVVALRGQRADSLAKRIGSWLFFKIFNFLSDLNYDAEAGNFRIISRNVACNLRNMRENLRLFGGLVTWMGFATAYVRVRHSARYEGQSSYTFAKLQKLAFETIIAYSDKPLRLAVRLGAFLAFVSFCFGVYIIARTIIRGVPVPGWSSLMVSLFFLGGIIISTLGILGIYTGKIFDEVKRRPLYVIAKSTDERRQIHAPVREEASHSQ